MSEQQDRRDSEDQEQRYCQVGVVIQNYARVDQRKREQSGRLDNRLERAIAVDWTEE